MRPCRRIAFILLTLAAALASTAEAQTNAVQASKQLTAAEVGTAAVLAFDGAKGVAFST